MNRPLMLRILSLLLLPGLCVALSGWWLWTHTPDAQAVAQASRRATQPVTLEQVAPTLVTALIATEDRRFHQHPGIDARRVAGALWATLRGDLQGGSTLTQQLARNLFPQHVGHRRTLLRKLREAAVALKIERAYSKREILTLYLNQVPFLDNVTGVEMAARSCFGKPAAELDRHEAALLVALLRGPAYYDPQRWPERARQRRDLVLTLLARHEGLDMGRLQHDLSRPLGLRPRDAGLQRGSPAAPVVLASAGGAGGGSTSAPSARCGSGGSATPSARATGPMLVACSSSEHSTTMNARSKNT